MQPPDGIPRRWHDRYSGGASQISRDQWEPPGIDNRDAVLIGFCWKEIDRVLFLCVGGEDCEMERVVFFGFEIVC